MVCHVNIFQEKMKMNSSLGVNLRVTGHCNQGDRKYMEDMFCVAYQQTEDGEDLEYAYFGIFDGHGGKEAAVFAREHLMEFIVNEKKFWSDDDEDVLSAIRCGYLATHNAMWKELGNWPKTASGLPSTSGTTATVAFIRNGKIYVGHVGDSSLVLGYQASPGPPHDKVWLAMPLTQDHKPESQDEISRIQRSGGKVKSKSGVPRVVWNRPRIGHKGPVRRSTPIDEIPFLAVARSLGDLWSYNSDSDQFVVSPEPDVRVVKIDTSIHRCLIFGTDGFWNMYSPSEAVLTVQSADKFNEDQTWRDPQERESMWVNPSKSLVDRALRKWNALRMRADNTSVVTLFLNPPCSQGGCQPSKTTIVSHNHYVEAASPEIVSELPMPLQAIPTEALAIPDPIDPQDPEQHIIHLTNAIPYLPEPGNEDQPKFKTPLNNILPLLNTKHSFDFEDFRKEKAMLENGCATAPSPEPLIQYGGVDSSASGENYLREMKMSEEVYSREDERPLLMPLSNEATPSPITNPIAASTPAYHPAVGVCYSKSVASKEKVTEALQRRGRTHPLKGVLTGAGPSHGNVLPLSSNVESSSHLRGLKRRHSSAWNQANSSSEGKEMKKRTRSEDKSLLVCNGEAEYYTEDAENERVAWPSRWLNKMRPCGGDEGSEENSVLNCSVRRKKKWMRSSEGPLKGLRQASRSRPSGHLFQDRRDHSRTLRSDTNAASQSRTLRSRNVDVRASVKIPVLGSKVASLKRGVHLRALSSELSPFSRSSNLLQASKSAVSSPRRRIRSIVTRSRV